MRYGFRDWLLYFLVWSGVLLFGFNSYVYYGLHGLTLPSVYAAVLLILGLIVWDEHKQAK